MNKDTYLKVLKALDTLPPGCQQSYRITDNEVLFIERGVASEYKCWFTDYSEFISRHVDLVNGWVTLKTLRKKLKEIAK